MAIPLLLVVCCCCCCCCCFFKLFCCVHFLFWQDMLNDYECLCAPGFFGLHCETDIDECLPHPCINQGTCVDQVDGYSCICAPEFTVRLYTLTMRGWTGLLHFALWREMTLIAVLPSNFGIWLLRSEIQKFGMGVLTNLHTQLQPTRVGWAGRHRFLLLLTYMIQLLAHISYRAILLL